MINKEWALACAARGWEVFPSMSKKPLIKWSTGATQDPDRIVDLWDTWPDADVCIATGARSGIVVVDWDSYKSGPLAAFPLTPYPHTYTCLTLKGGYHFYFQHPGYSVANSAGLLAEHVDVRGDGGMVVAYQPANNRPLVHAPEGWLTERQRPTPDADASLTPPHNPTELPTGWNKTLLDSSVARIRTSESGKRNATLYAIASDTYRALSWEGWIAPEHVTQALGDAAHEVGLDPEEICKTLLSAMRNAATKGA